MADDIENNDISLWLGLSLIDGLSGQTLCQLPLEFSSPEQVYSPRLVS